MNEDFTTNKYNTVSAEAQAQNASTPQNGYTQQTDNRYIPPQQFRPQPQVGNQQYAQQNSYQPQPQQTAQQTGQQYAQQTGYQQTGQQYTQPAQQQNFSQRPFDLGKQEQVANAPQYNGTSQNNTSQQGGAYQANNAYQQQPVYYPPKEYYQYYYQPTPEELERQAVRKASGYAGKTTLTILITMGALSIITLIIALVCGMVDLYPSETDPYMGFSQTGFYFYEGMLSLLSIFIPTWLLIKLSDYKTADLVTFKKVEGKQLAAIVTGGMALCMLSQIIATLFGINLSLFGIDIYAGLESTTPTGIFDIVMSTICTAVIPGLVEEFAFRGLVIGVLKKHGDLFAILTSAFLFGILHGNFAQIPFAFVVGLVLGYARVKTDSMLPAILIHFGNNFFAVIMSTLYEVLSESFSSIVESIVMIVIIVAGFIAISYLAKNHKDFFELKDKESLLTFNEKIKIFFSNGVVIADIVILSVSSVALVAML